MTSCRKVVEILRSVIRETEELRDTADACGMNDLYQYSTGYMAAMNDMAEAFEQVALMKGGEEDD